MTVILTWVGHDGNLGCTAKTVTVTKGNQWAFVVAFMGFLEGSLNFESNQGQLLAEKGLPK